MRFKIRMLLMQDIGESFGSNKEEQEGLLPITWTQDVWSMGEKNIIAVSSEGHEKMRKHLEKKVDKRDF